MKGEGSRSRPLALSSDHRPGPSVHKRWTHRWKTSPRGRPVATAVADGSGTPTGGLCSQSAADSLPAQPDCQWRLWRRSGALTSCTRNLLDVSPFGQVLEARAWCDSYTKRPECQRLGPAKRKRSQQPPAFAHKDTFMSNSNGQAAEGTWRHLLNESKAPRHCLLEHDWKSGMT